MLQRSSVPIVTLLYNGPSCRQLRAVIKVTYLLNGLLVLSLKLFILSYIDLNCTWYHCCPCQSYNKRCH